jgi:hypothetical protein
MTPCFAERVVRGRGRQQSYGKMRVIKTLIGESFRYVREKFDGIYYRSVYDIGAHTGALK